MMPTLNEIGDVVLTDRLSLRWNPIHRGDIVVGRSPSNGTQVLKRVTALPGDVVLMRGREPLVVPEGHVWIEGDNAQSSHDSRYYGPMPIENISGRVCAKLWPLTEARWLSRDHPRPTRNDIMLQLADPELVARMRRDMDERRALYQAFGGDNEHIYGHATETPVTSLTAVAPVLSMTAPSALFDAYRSAMLLPRIHAAPARTDHDRQPDVAAGQQPTDDDAH